MKSNWLKYSGIFILVIALQILVFNQVVVKIGSWFFIPYVYILAIMLLPFETKNEIIYISAFILGITIDIFSGTLALHAAASVIMASFRSIILAWIAPRLGYQQGVLPSYLNYGLIWFIKYALLMAFIHHLWFYFWNIFSLKYLYLVLIKSIINTILSVLFIVFLHYLIKNRPLAL